MFISKKHISRRTVLQGIGATIALPFLDAMSPAATAWAQTPAGKTPKRFAFVAFSARRDHGSLVAERDGHGLHHVADP
jgi:nicotinic acid phosphoribosyltransferase